MWEDSMNELLLLEACKRRLNGLSTHECWHQVRLVLGESKFRFHHFFLKLVLNI